MSLSKSILIGVYILLVAISIYNIVSFIPNYGMAAYVRQGVSGSYQFYFEVRNNSEAIWEDVDILLNDEHFYHISTIQKQEMIPVELFYFLPIKYRPESASFINLDKYIDKIEYNKNLSNIVDKKSELKIFKKNGYFYKKLQ